LIGYLPYPSWVSYQSNPTARHYLTKYHNIVVSYWVGFFNFSGFAKGDT